MSKITINNPFSLLIKPASGDCNLNCTYCFYLDKASLYPHTKVHRMSSKTLENLIAGYMRTTQPQYTFGWQGGEPTLMGVDFFKSVIQLQQKYGRTGDFVANGLQTNGLLIDDALAAHLAEYHFLVGVSLDGPPEIHNTYRMTRTGQPTHHKVLNGIKCLGKHGVEFNILTLVHSGNVMHPGDVYDYLVDNDFYFHQYIPCVEWDDAGNPAPYALAGKDWGYFLCGIFDRWLQRKHTRKVSVRHFDSILEYLVYGSQNVCVMGTNCNSYFLVEHNGDVYPCDFFAEPELKIGNIQTHDWHSMQTSSVFRDFGLLKRQYHTGCRTCEFLTLCQGDCTKHRYGTESSPTALSWLCEGWKIFYRHSMDTFTHIAQEIKKEQLQMKQQQMRHTGGDRPSGTDTMRKIGRNAPCPCGSGKKYKRCCGR